MLSQYYGKFESITKNVPYINIMSESENLPSLESLDMQNTESKSDLQLFCIKNFNETIDRLKGIESNFNVPFHWSHENGHCQLFIDEKDPAYNSILKHSNVYLIISAFGKVYERSYPKIDSNHVKFDYKNEFDQQPGMPVYITLNGVSEIEEQFITKKDFNAISSGESSYGILQINDYENITYQQLSHDEDSIDLFRMKIIDFEEQQDEDFFIYVIYAILAGCILGMVYFVYNWIRCIMSRPPELDDDSSSDEEYQGEIRHRHKVQESEDDL